VTAFLYSGLAARSFWMTAILAPRFLATAFAAGPALLILVCMAVRRLTGYDVGREALKKLGVIVAYAMAVNVFFILLEVFTITYSGIPEHADHLSYMYLGLHGKSALVPWMFASSVIGLFALVLLLVPKLRNKEGLLAIACVAVVVSIWIEKGMAMVVAGFVPNPFHKVNEYSLSLTELMVSLGIYAIGALILVGLLKVAITVRQRGMKPAP
jgi:molybdopterin-containing oxidoreductase family membrane subunit